MITKTGLHAIRAMVALARLPDGVYAGAATVAEGDRGAAELPRQDLAGAGGRGAGRVAEGLRRRVPAGPRRQADLAVRRRRADRAPEPVVGVHPRPVGVLGGRAVRDARAVEEGPAGVHRHAARRRTWPSWSPRGSRPSCSCERFFGVKKDNDMRLALETNRLVADRLTGTTRIPDLLRPPRRPAACWTVMG